MGQKNQACLYYFIALMDRHEAEALLKQFGISPKRSLGQSFLVDPKVIESVTKQAELTREDQVIEIGPGLGALTKELSEKAGRVIAIEIDQRLIPVLEHVLEHEQNTIIYHQDALKVNLNQYSEDWNGSTLVVGSLPYYATTPLIEKVICELPKSRRLVFIMQKEAVDRILSKPGSKTYGPTSVLIALYGTAKQSTMVSPHSFWPQPHVLSQVLIIDRLSKPQSDSDVKPVALPVDVSLRFSFLHFLRQCFSQRRKKLIHTLPTRPDQSAEALLTQCGLSPDIRPEQVAPESYRLLFELCDLV